MRRGPTEAALSRFDEHVGKARLEPQRGDSPAVLRDSPIGIDCAEAREPLPRLGDRGFRRRVEEGKPPGIRLTPKEAA